MCELCRIIDIINGLEEQPKNRTFDDIMDEFLDEWNKQIEDNKLVKKAEEYGRREDKLEIAKSLLTSTLTIEKIAKHTGLSIEEVEKLKK